MVLSQVGIIADALWHEIKNHAKNVQLDAFVVMPNHIHGIIIINDVPAATPVETTHALSLPNDATATPVETTHALSLPTPGHLRFQHQGENSLSSIVGAYKSAVSKQAHRMGFKFAWQTRFHDHIIRNNESYQQISEYILANTKNWNEDKFYKDNPD
jgi:REP element-mobilizing transposase RayT